jgi:predicted metal-dependent hydrolase
VHAVEVSDRIIWFDVRHSTRARRARLIVHPWERVEVVLPPRFPAGEAERLVRRHSAWLLARLAECPAPRPPLSDGEEILWRGDNLTLRVRAGHGQARVGDGELTIAVANPSNLEGIRRAIERFGKAEARRLFELEVAEAASALGAYPTRLAIRDQRTRWGSCSSRGTISFSWRLVHAPPAALRYVAVHEVCHLVEPNHQPPFWALVDRLMPDWREQRRWLRRHGSTLRYF